MKKIKNIIVWIVEICLLVFLLCIISNVLENKTSVEKFEPFFEQVDDYDVLFFGNSHIADAIYPMELWDEYGITSYNLASSGNEIATSYWSMRNALDYCTPKLVVIDTYLAWSNQKVGKTGLAHGSLDVYPLSLTKIHAVNDLFDDPEAISSDGKMIYQEKYEFLWTVGKYHSRWNELTKQDFSIDYYPGKGGIINSNVDYVKRANSQISESQKTEYDSIGMEYLRMMIEECQSRKIDVLLVAIPYNASENNQKCLNKINDIAQEYGLNYINYNTGDSVVDFNTDLFDKGVHLNASGARKVTQNLGQFIQDTYHISNRKDNSDYEDWFFDYDEYTEYKRHLIQSESELPTYLMLLNDRNLDIVIRICQDSKFLKNESIYNLIDNIDSIGNTEIVIDEDMGVNQIRITVKDNRNGKIWDDTEWIYNIQLPYERN